MYNEYYPYQNTYRGGYMPYGINEDARNSYGYLADDLQPEFRKCNAKSVLV